MESKITGIMKRKQKRFLHNPDEAFFAEGKRRETDTDVMERKWNEALIFYILAKIQKIKEDLT